MVAVRMNCDPKSLKMLVEDRLSPASETKLTSHLDICPDCCEHLECLTANAAAWEDARDSLRQTNQMDFHQTSSASSSTAKTGLTAADENSDSILTEDGILSILEPSDSPHQLGRLSDYEILEIIGRGGMGVVLRGFEPQLNRFVAIKILAPQFAGNGAARKRFAREARAAAAVVHHHVVPIFGIDENQKLPYLVMPYIPGRSLQHRIDEQGYLPVDEILRIAKQTAEGLAAAHAQGLVHRDIKPANILLENTVERVLITDFGLARAADDAVLTCTGTIAGTPPFMSPEQAKGEAMDHRSDLFSLGSVIYAMCTGRTPFRASSTVGILRRISDHAPTRIREINPSIPSWLVKLVDRLHEKNPDDRIQSADDVAAILEKCLAHSQHPDRISLPLELVEKSRWTWRFVVLAGTILASLIGITIGAYFVFSNWGNRSDLATKQEERMNRSQHILPLHERYWDSSVEEQLDQLEQGIVELENRLP